MALLRSCMKSIFDKRKANFVKHWWEEIMKTVCSTAGFTKLPLEDALKNISELGFDFVDLLMMAKQTRHTRYNINYHFVTIRKYMESQEGI